MISWFWQHKHSENAATSQSYTSGFVAIKQVGNAATFRSKHLVLSSQDMAGDAVISQIQKPGLVTTKHTTLLHIPTQKHLVLSPENTLETLRLTSRKHLVLSSQNRKLSTLSLKVFMEQANANVS